MGPVIATSYRTYSCNIPTNLFLGHPQHHGRCAWVRLPADDDGYEDPPTLNTAMSAPYLNKTFPPWSMCLLATTSCVWRESEGGGGGEGEEERARRRGGVACRWAWLIFRLLRRKQRRVGDGVDDRRRHPTTAAKGVPKPQHLRDLAPSEMTCIRRAWS